MILADCISLEEPIPEGLLDFIEQLGRILEIKAVAYKDLSAAPPGSRKNNLYNYWHMHIKGVEDTSPDSL